MKSAKAWLSAAVGRRWIEHSVRSAVAAVASLLAASLLRLPEAYWAAITTMIVMQSSLGAALSVSWQRLIGTALGAAAGALLASYYGWGVAVFGAGVFGLGLISALFRLDRNGYRFASIALAIVMLPTHGSAPRAVAWHRFLEVSMGVVVGLIVTAAWPEPKQLRPAGS